MDYTPVELPIGGLDDESGDLVHNLLMDAYRVTLHSFLPDQRDHYEEVVNEISSTMLANMNMTEGTPDDFGQPMFDAMKTALSVALLRSSQFRETMNLSAQVHKAMMISMERFKTEPLA